MVLGVVGTLSGLRMVFLSRLAISTPRSVSFSRSGPPPLAVLRLWSGAAALTLCCTRGGEGEKQRASCKWRWVHYTLVGITLLSLGAREATAASRHSAVAATPRVLPGAAGDSGGGQGPRGANLRRACPQCCEVVFGLRCATLLADFGDKAKLLLASLVRSSTGA